MANANATVLENLKTARDAIIAAIAEGRLTVSYTIRGRTHETSDPVKALQGIEKLIEMYTLKANRRPYRAVSLSRPVRRGE